jgi:DNA replication licensing factor MCM5
MDRYLCDKIVPGNRVTVTGIYSIKRVAAAGKVKLKL